MQEPRATSLDCRDPQQVPSRLAPLALPRGPGGHLFLPPGPAEGMAAPAPHPAPMQDPGWRGGLLTGALGLASGPRGVDGDLQSFAHPFSSGKDRRPYLGPPSWPGDVLGSGVPPSPRFSDPRALEVSQPEKGAGPRGAGMGQEGLWPPLRPWLAVPGLGVGAGAWLCPATWALS